MIDIEVLRKYYLDDMVLVSEHAAMRFKQRGLKAKDIIGKSGEGKWIHFVMSNEGSMSRIITAYYPDPDKWSEDLKTRKEQ